MSCVDTGPFNGGVYNDPTVISPAVTGGTATGMELKGATLTGGVSLDATSATQLLSALQEQTPVFVSNNPKSTSGTDLPTEVIGDDRSQLLGKPAGFIKLGAYMVPVYRAE